MLRAQAWILVGADATILEASDGALQLLGLTLEQLRALPPGALSLEADREASAHFEVAWRGAGGGTVVGVGTARLLDGTLLRVRYLITPHPDGTFEIIFEPSDEAASEPPRTYTIGSVLSAWRAAERKLEAVHPGSDEWAAVQTEIEQLRSEYHRMARAREGQTEGWRGQAGLDTAPGK